MSKRDYYDILGVQRDAAEDQIKRAYREKAKLYHPDRNPDDKSAETKFLEVQEAYEVLKDSEKRKMYDRFGHAGFESGTHAGEWRTAPGGQRAYTWQGGSGDYPDLEDLFRGGEGGGFGGIGDFFSRATRRKRPRGREADLDVRTDARLTFEQAIHGSEMSLTLSSPTGEKQTLTVKIPPGVRDGQTIRLKGKGSRGGDGRAGDVLLTCRVAAHRYYRREGDDIYLDVPISITEATLGAKIEVPTLLGPTVVTIPPGTAGGSKLRLKDKGVRSSKTGQAGHQYLTMRIIPPRVLNDEQRKLLKQLQSLSTDDPRKDLW